MKRNEKNNSNLRKDNINKKKIIQKNNHINDIKNNHINVEISPIRKRRYFLLSGILIGIILAYYVPVPIKNDWAKRFQEKWQDISIFSNSTFPLNFPGVLQNINFSKSILFQEQLLASFDFRPMISVDQTSRPGEELNENENIKYHFPILMLPGFTSTGLEIWKGRPCAKSYFRQRIWGTSRMFQQFMMNQQCWLEHLMLNMTSGLDPNNIKLRAALGLEAADYVVGGFWVWAKIIENLADIGYDSNNMFMFPFDWRLAPHLMEKRDSFFTKLKLTIEMLKKTNKNKKIILIGHSFAHQVAFFFMKWVESNNGGSGGKLWVDQHVETYISIAGPMLGVPKSVSTLLSGEMKDTAELGVISGVLEYFFSPLLRTMLGRSWPSISAMLPIGGNKIWGNHSFAPDDFVSRIPDSIKIYSNPSEFEDNNNSINEKMNTEINNKIHLYGSNGHLIGFAADSIVNSRDNSSKIENVTADNISQLLESIDPNFSKLKRWFNLEYLSRKKMNKNYDNHVYWINPLISPLPFSPNLKIYCFYGVGKPAERSYIYKKNHKIESDNANDNGNIPYILNVEYNRPPWIRSGIRYSEGDGTVPLVSLGYMCAKGWRNNINLNPSNLSVIIREYDHAPVSIFKDPRGGPSSADHVDILGNYQMIKDILYIASNNRNKVNESIKSEINELVKKIDW